MCGWWKLKRYATPAESGEHFCCFNHYKGIKHLSNKYNVKANINSQQFMYLNYEFRSGAINDIAGRLFRIFQFFFFFLFN